MRLTGTLQRNDTGQCIQCSLCGALIPVMQQAHDLTLLEVRCGRCGVTDVYHIKMLQCLRTAREAGRKQRAPLQLSVYLRQDR